MTSAPLTNRERALEAKECTRCGAPKALDQFPRDHRMPDGTKNQCKACAAELQNENRDRLRRERPLVIVAERQAARPDLCPECGRWPTRPESGLCDPHHQLRELQLGGGLSAPSPPGEAV